MRSAYLSLLLVFALTPAACDDATSPTIADGARLDAGSFDGGQLDIGVPDAIGPDAESPADVGAPDVGLDARPDVGCADHPGADQDIDDDGLTQAEECRLGTDPTVADSDGDGIDDGEEVGHGAHPSADPTNPTNPTDPASARAWHPERWVGRPRLYFGPEDVAPVRQRAIDPSPAHAHLLDRIRSLAHRALPEHPEEGAYDTAVASARAAIAEAQAFLGLIESDTALADSAVAILVAPFPDPSDLGLLSGYDIREAEAMVAYCSAYDLLAAHPDLSSDTQAQARAGLELRIDTFRQMCLAGPLRPMVALSRNNHAMKVQAALGLCALALNDRATAAADLNEGITGLFHLFDAIQGTAEGGYAEGWNYLSYGGNSHLPFMLAYHRFAQGETFRYHALGRSVYPFPDKGKIVEVPDFASHPPLRAIFERALFVTRPDGQTPPTDDANPSPLHGPLIAALLDDERFLWNWMTMGTRGGPQFPATRTEVASFIVYDGRADPAPLEGPPDGCFPEAGLALFREDLGPDARYFLLQGEHGPARQHGFGHEHPDATSFLLYAFGEPLLLDSGYINWDHHNLVNRAPDHSLVLIDGEGPPLGNTINVGVDAFLEQWDPDPDLTTVTVRAEYAGAQIIRRVVRVRGDYFVVADQIDHPPDEASPTHTHTSLLHGHGGGDLGEGTFERTPHGARWTRPRARIEAWVAATGGELRFETYDDEHQAGWGRFLHHTVLAAHVDQGPNAGFLTVLVPRATAMGSPVVTVSQTPGSVVMQVADDTIRWRLGSLDETAGLTIEMAGQPARRWPPGRDYRAD